MRHVAVCIPTIPKRAALLARAIASVEAQVVGDDVLVQSYVYTDNARDGAWVARNRAIDLAFAHNPDWVLFLDDDDELDADAVRILLAAADDSNADIVWGWFRVEGGHDPFSQHRGKQLDAYNPHIVPIVYMTKTPVLKDAHSCLPGGCFQPNMPGTAAGNWFIQDFPVLNHMVSAGAQTLAIPDIVWTWHHHGRNTSGMPDQEV
jgi:glycosyltransferase involved in cell wall biosynthesis